MKVAAFVPSVRPELLQKLLLSWRAHSTPAELGFSELHVHAQREPPFLWRSLAADFQDLPLRWTLYPHGSPVWPMRVRGVLSAPDVDVWVHLDDDMEFLPQTTYTASIAKALEPGVGVVSCNWVRSESPGFLKRSWPPRDPVWIKQPLVNMSGGMIYAKKIVPVLAESVETPWLFDDIQVGLSAYLAGYENWRYRGSLAIHRILSAGGIKVINGELPHALPDVRWLPVRQSVDTSCPIPEHNVYMPVSADVTSAAHEQHARARRALGLL